MGSNVNAFDLVTLTPVDPPGRNLRCHLVGNGKLTGGDGGWTVVDRPRLKGATQWDKVDPYQLTVPLLLDGMDLLGDGVDVSIEAEIERLLSWTFPAPETGRPPLLLVDGPLPVPAANPRWGLARLDLADDEIRRGDRHRIRQEVTVTLLEHSAAQVLLGPTAAARARAGL